MKSYCLFVILVCALNACTYTEKPAETHIDKDSVTESVKAEASEVTAVDSIAGVYIEKPLGDETGSCPIKLAINQVIKGYNYHLTLNEQHYQGKATLSRNEDDTLITFEGIEWAEYEGDISNDTGEEHSNDTATVDTPKDIGANFNNGELIIQNTGNSMNYYVKFAGCDRKYIRLVKQK